MTQSHRTHTHLYSQIHNIEFIPGAPWTGADNRSDNLIKHTQTSDISSKKKRTEWCGSVAGNHITAVMSRLGYELRLWRFGNKHTSQIEPGGYESGDLSKDYIKSEETYPFLPHSHLLVTGLFMCVVAFFPPFTGKCRLIMCERREGRFAVLSLLPFKWKKRSVADLHSHMELLWLQTRTSGLSWGVCSRWYIYVKKCLIKAGKLYLIRVYLYCLLSYTQWNPFTLIFTTDCVV